MAAMRSSVDDFETRSSASSASARASRPGRQGPSRPAPGVRRGLVGIPSGPQDGPGRGSSPIAPSMAAAPLLMAQPPSDPHPARGHLSPAPAQLLMPLPAQGSSSPTHGASPSPPASCPFAQHALPLCQLLGPHGPGLLPQRALAGPAASALLLPSPLNAPAHHPGPAVPNH